MTTTTTKGDDLIAIAEEVMRDPSLSQYQRTNLEREIKQARAGNTGPLEKRLMRLTAPESDSDSADGAVGAAPDSPAAADSEGTAPQYAELPDEYIEPALADEFLFEAVPGFHISPWLDNQEGRTKMKRAQAVPLREGDPRISPDELIRLDVTDEGIYTYSGYLLGIETDNHYKMRYEARVSRPARNLTKNLPKSENVTDLDTNIHYGTVTVVTPSRRQ